MKTILLIQPRFTAERLDRNIKTLYPIGLGYIAAMVPDTWGVKIIDEQLQEIDFETTYNAVGISATTLTVNRAYEIAERFREKGIPVILGGVHPSLCPEEASRYCDAICIGDGESVIGEILKDIELSRLKKVYTGGQKPLDSLPRPRRDLFLGEYTFMPVSTTRGCPFDCNFCAINQFYNGSYRKRAPEDVIDELKSLPRTHEIVFFTDGNMYGYSKQDIQRFREICSAIATERKKGTLPFKYFTCYASINALEDEESLDIASEAGCFALFVGFESINPASLKEMNKKLNLKYGIESYTRLVENARKRKILVVGEMIVGTDADDAKSLEETRIFLQNINFDLLRLQILQPLPGTRLFASLEKENRLFLKSFPCDWQKLADDFIMGVHYQPARISPEKLKSWTKRTGLEFYSPIRMIQRTIKSLFITGSIKMALTTLIMNIKSRKTYANATIEMVPDTRPTKT